LRARFLCSQQPCRQGTASAGLLAAIFAAAGCKKTRIFAADCCKKLFVWFWFWLFVLLLEERKGQDCISRQG
jgi:hypothetical protein